MSTTLQDTTDARKARLLELRAQRDRKRKASAAEGEAADNSNTPSVGIVYRNYDEEKRGFKGHDRNEEQEETVESQVQGMAADIVQNDAERRGQELDLFNIQPKKPNWDLKRDVEKKMSKLDYQTKAAVAQLIRQRIAAEKGKNGDANGTAEADAALATGQADLAKAVGQRAVAEEMSDEEDD